MWIQTIVSRHAVGNLVNHSSFLPLSMTMVVLTNKSQILHIPSQHAIQTERWLLRNLQYHPLQRQNMVTTSMLGTHLLRVTKQLKLDLAVRLAGGNLVP
jgi:hypothetical protein